MSTSLSSTVAIIFSLDVVGFGEVQVPISHATISDVLSKEYIDSVDDMTYEAVANECHVREPGQDAAGFFG